ncbi:heme ABC transporter ATP-binding protein [Radicibacter daui]|uniref:heme ABC transporter ATP-binding protein n=1 Tax=Radicibacter daui TaxID=3064829 RepID=UPI0040468BB2
MLALRNIHVRRNGRDLLAGVDLDVRAGQVTAVLGPNGAGKSTLLSVAAGTLRPEGGTARLEGRALSGHRPLELARRRAVLPQRESLEFGFTVEQVVAMGRIAFARDGNPALDREAVALALEAVDMQHLAANPYTQLSGGERQRAQLARVLAQLHHTGGPQGLLLLDEPSSALDLSHQRQLVLAMRRLAGAGCGVLVILHDLGLAAAVADEVLVLAEGRVRACSTPEAVLTRELVADVYNVPALVRQDAALGHVLVQPVWREGAGTGAASVAAPTQKAFLAAAAE